MEDGNPKDQTKVAMNAAGNVDLKIDLILKMSSLDIEILEPRAQNGVQKKEREKNQIKIDLFDLAAG